MSVPLISVIVPSYNQGHWIDSCLRSLFAQQDSNLEVIVVDGGSTDTTLEVLDLWRPQLAACIVERDDGQADAIAKGFSMARGEILAWLNSDDMHLPWTIGAWRKAFASDESLEMVHGDRVIVDAEGRVTGYRRLPGHSGYWLNRFPWTHQETAAWRRGLYERAGGVDPQSQNPGKRTKADSDDEQHCEHHLVDGAAGVHHATHRLVDPGGHDVG